MSSTGSTVTISSSPPFSQVGDVVFAIGDYLDDASALAGEKVCKVWRDSLQERLAPLKEDEYCRRIGYPPELVQAFRSRQLSLWRLPELDLGGRTGLTGQIDFLTPADLTSPLMRFTDACGRVGLALRVRGNADGDVGIHDEIRPIRQYSHVSAVFKRYTDSDRWVNGDNYGVINRIYKQVHRPNHTVESEFNLCPTCPPFLKSEYISWAIALITQTDPIIKIDGEIEQLAPAPLPPMPLRPAVEPRPALPVPPPPAPVVIPVAPVVESEPLSLPQRIWKTVSGFFLKIASLLVSFHYALFVRPFRIYLDFCRSIWQR